jgi:hypoxanthine phosphoribosyltransferase
LLCRDHALGTDSTWNRPRPRSRFFGGFEDEDENEDEDETSWRLQHDFQTAIEHVRYASKAARKKILGKAGFCSTIEFMKPPALTSPAGPDERVPAEWRKEVARVLITETQLARRIRRLSREIEQDFEGREMVIVSLLSGTVMFLADLIRHISLPLRLDFMGVSSYGPGTESRELVFTKELRLDVRGRDVLLVDDILDTGKTMTSVLAKLALLEPRRIRTCVLLNKASRRVENIKADYVGFEIPDEFVVGYGLDFAERYRNLPFVGVLHREIYETAVNSAEPGR